MFNSESGSYTVLSKAGLIEGKCMTGIVGCYDFFTLFLAESYDCVISGDMGSCGSGESWTDTSYSPLNTVGST